MLKNIFITGDNHGDFSRYRNIEQQYWSNETGIIVLGDFSINFYLSKTDTRKKEELMENYPFYFYVIRGNHEARPQNLPGIQLIYDYNVQGHVYYEEAFPRIRYFMDYGVYNIKGYNCLIIGGAYSVDKKWRLDRVGLTEQTNIPKQSGWFNDEQLTQLEMTNCMSLVKALNINNQKIDFIMSHTCPTSFQPVDMVLGFIDQSTVDNSMENFLEKIIHSIDWNIYLFGHYHADRIELPHVEQYYYNIDNIDTIFNRWKLYDNDGEIDWYLKKGPKFYDR